MPLIFSTSCVLNEGQLASLKKLNFRGKIFKNWINSTPKNFYDGQNRRVSANIKPMRAGLPRLSNENKDFKKMH